MSAAEVVIEGDCPQTYSIERTFTAVDACGNASTTTKWTLWTTQPCGGDRDRWLRRRGFLPIAINGWRARPFRAQPRVVRRLRRRPNLRGGDVVSSSAALEVVLESTSSLAGETLWPLRSSTTSRWSTLVAPMKRLASTTTKPTCWTSCEFCFADKTRAVALTKRPATTTAMRPTTMVLTTTP